MFGHTAYDVACRTARVVHLCVTIAVGQQSDPGAHVSATLRLSAAVAFSARMIMKAEFVNFLAGFVAAQAAPTNVVTPASPFAASSERAGSARNCTKLSGE